MTLESGEVITAHVPNSGSMKTSFEEGCDVYVSHHDTPKRKLKYTLELTRMHGNYICVNTGYANKLAVEAIQKGVIKELQGYESLKTEQKYGKNSRIDILLENSDEKCYVEIKSVTLKIEEAFAFPDAVTTRGQKHLKELESMVSEGHRAVMLYIIQRQDGESFRIAKEIDPTYNALFSQAHRNGVEVLVYQSSISPKEIRISHSIGITL